MSISLSSNFNLSAQLALDARTVVADATARDAIAAIQRYQGLTVYLTSTSQTFQLQGGILDANWVQILGAGGSTFFADNVYASFGNTSATPDVRLGWNTAQTVDAFYLGLPDAQNVMIIAENGDRAFDFGHGAQGTPTLFFQSNNQSTTEWGSITSTPTDFFFTVGGDGSNNGQSIVFQMNTYNGFGPAFKIKDGLGTTIFSLTDDGLSLSIPGNFGTAATLFMGIPFIIGSQTDFFFDVHAAFHFITAAAPVGNSYSIGQGVSNTLNINAPTGATINPTINGTSIASFSATTSIFNNRLESSKGADVASANNLTLGTDGNTFTITGTTTINAITIASWQAGSHLTLIFSGALTVKHNTAGGAGTGKIFLAGSVDLTTAANTVLGLVYDGTQFQETSRKVA